MKKNLIISFLLLILTLSVFIGCSDDDDETIIAAAAAQGYLIGYAYAYDDSEFEFYADIMPMTNNGFTIDSIVIEDTTAGYRDDSYWNSYGDGNYQWTELYVDSANSPGYYPGDTAEIKFYRNNSMTTLNIELMDYDLYPTFISPGSNDTIAIGESRTIVWNATQDADFYGIYISYRRDSLGTTNYDYLITATRDTTYTIPGSFNGYDGYQYIYIIAANGPIEGDIPNLNGAGLIGNFHSYTDTDDIQAYVGTGNPNPVSNGQNEPTIEDKTSSKIIMDHLTGHKLQKDNH